MTFFNEVNVKFILHQCNTKTEGVNINTKVNSEQNVQSDSAKIIESGSKYRQDVIFSESQGYSFPPIDTSKIN